MEKVRDEKVDWKKGHNELWIKYTLKTDLTQELSVM